MFEKGCLKCDYSRVHEDGIYCSRYDEWVYNEDCKKCRSYIPWKLALLDGVINNNNKKVFP